MSFTKGLCLCGPACVRSEPTTMQPAVLKDTNPLSEIVSSSLTMLAFILLVFDHKTTF